LKKIHIGHHFFGSGNFGDDLMLAGFLKRAERHDIAYSCCVPYSLDALQKRFPQVTWLPYNHDARSNAIKNCDVWLGLGGSPFQNTVSQWFIEHLEQEATLCSKYKKRIYFLGIGGQDQTALIDARLKTIINLSESVWLRDNNLYNHLMNSNSLDKNRLHQASDLAHIIFKNHIKRKIKHNTITATLNFDYNSWPLLDSTLNSIKKLSLNEHFWLIQEKRTLPGSEKDIYSKLTSEQQFIWKSIAWDNSENNILDSLNMWPSTEFMLTSRFHATLASAWSGAKTVVLPINLKLKTLSEEYGIQLLSIDKNPYDISEALDKAKPVPMSILHAKARLAESSVDDFFTEIQK
jgi:polysaccharide pyruvyl transferase WcaK-like protein